VVLEVGKEYSYEHSLSSLDFVYGICGFLLVGSTPSITSVTILGLITGAATGIALGIMFTHRAKRRHT
jgi:hypothetical protein